LEKEILRIGNPGIKEIATIGGGEHEVETDSGRLVSG